MAFFTYVQDFFVFKQAIQTFQIKSPVAVVSCVKALLAKRSEKGTRDKNELGDPFANYHPINGQCKNTTTNWNKALVQWYGN